MIATVGFDQNLVVFIVPSLIDHRLDWLRVDGLKLLSFDRDRGIIYRRF